MNILPENLIKLRANIKRKPGKNYNRKFMVCTFSPSSLIRVIKSRRM
jgi:hypothetical protein